MSREIASYRSLADQLRDWSDEQLTRLLTARPDLATPAPHDSGQLASRATTRASVLRALDRLDRWELLVLHSHALVAQTPVWTSADLLGADAPADASAVDRATQRLVDLALLWHSTEGLRVVTTVPDALGAGPVETRLPLEPLTPEALDRAEVERRLAALSPPARGLLEHVHGHGGRGTTTEDLRDPAPTTPIGELVRARLLVPRGRGEVRVAGETGAVLGLPEVAPTPPPLATSAREASVVDRAGAGAAAEAVRRTELLLDTWGTRPPGVLRGGGLAVRDLRAAAVLLGTEEAETALLVETAAAAQLLAEGTDADGELVWVPTDVYDVWSTRSVAQRWAVLARAWLASDRLPGLVGRRDEKTRKATNALEADLAHPVGAATRRATLAAVAGLPTGEVLATGTGVPSLVERIRWEHPRRPSLRDDVVTWTVAEASALGVLALGGATAAGRAVLADGEDEAVAALDPLLPDPVDKVLLQADLTAVAPGPLETELARRLQLVADLESSGGAGVYRFRASSVRRAFDVGWSAADVHAFVAEVSATPVPQPLTYLVDDVARTFGTVRVGHAEAFVRTDDETALTTLLHDPRAASLGLRRIAPTVLISTTPLDVLLPRLRELGAAPVVEAPDGTVRVARPDVLRARVGRARRTAAVAARDVAHTTSVVTAVRAGDRAAAARPRPETGGPTTSSPTSPAAALSALREAVEARRTVRIAYVDNHGSFLERVVDPLRVEGGQLTAHDHRSDDERLFAVHRITAVDPV
ncbi:helicase C-terminal domain-containing protein [Nocardioides zeae]|uniref:Helicase C-terminal domain-containing protein n=1 Tax=Nocardioides imazamoxiresistens TaxID=3231893 RepID=A0ABU3PYC2_9ACTN|nr:helicase C-terminal domain-containing protein [Nocardioides zeae]MDT9594248.1 helicase C-terminal domain-containing protein [Nocardioides zeae]